jgi:hypothetical protein
MAGVLILAFIEMPISRGSPPLVDTAHNRPSSRTNIKALPSGFQASVLYRPPPAHGASLNTSRAAPPAAGMTSTAL